MRFASLIILLAGILLGVAGCGLFFFWWWRRTRRQLCEQLYAIVPPVTGDSHEQQVRLDGLFYRLRDYVRGAEHRLDHLQQQHDRLIAVLGGMVEGVIAVDVDSRVLFANESAGEMLGFDSERATGRPLLALVREQGLHQLLQDTLVEAKPLQAEVELSLTAPRVVSVIGAPLPPSASSARSASVAARSVRPASDGVVLVLEDVTELRRLETLRRDFVANVSHELKTPLSAIKGYAETLQQGALEDVDVRQHFVEKIGEEADRLSRLILDLLSLARIEAGREAFELSDVALESAVAACVDRHRSVAREGGVQLVVKPPESPVHVLADEEAVRQILDNLVVNAIRYTPGEGAVELHWYQEGNEAVLHVRDSGIGISAEDQVRIFERFYRVDKARSRELGGTGLGLSIVKHLTQFFGGAVGVSSQPGEGSDFWVRLPVAGRNV